MKALFIPEHRDTPMVDFSIEKDSFVISGSSFPENSYKFFKPASEWLEEYIRKPKEMTCIEFKMKYYNSSSAKEIIKILYLLEKIMASSQVVIKWYYKKSDPAMLSAGEDYSSLLDLKFDFIEYE